MATICSFPETGMPIPKNVEFSFGNPSRPDTITYRGLFGDSKHIIILLFQHSCSDTSYESYVPISGNDTEEDISIGGHTLHVLSVEEEFITLRIDDA